MAFHRGFDGSEPMRPEPIGRLGGIHEEQRATRRLATGTLACPGCDAPVAPGEGTLTPRSQLACPFCGHTSVLRDFLSLDAPARPARVVVSVRVPAVPPRGARGIRR